MNIIFKSITVMLTIINIKFLYASNPETHEKSNSALENFNIENHNIFLDFFLEFSELHDLLKKFSNFLKFEYDLSYNKFFIELSFLNEKSERIIEEIKEKKDFKERNRENSGYYHLMNYVEQLNNHCETKNIISVILRELLTHLNQTLNKLLNIKCYFQKFDPFYMHLKYIIQILISETNNKISIMKSKKYRNRIYKISVTEENKNMANISAHQLIGCCQDGRCGSLSEKNKSIDKRDRKNKKKREKKKNKKEKDVEENNEDKNDNKEIQETTDAAVDKNTQIINQKELNEIKDTLLEDSLTTVSKIVKFLFKILELEQIFYQNITQVRSLFEILLLAKDKRFDLSVRQKLHQILKNEFLSRYSKIKCKDLNTKAIDLKRYNLSLKICSLSCRKCQSYKENKMKEYCPHCQCYKCKTKYYKPKATIYSIF